MEVDSRTSASDRRIRALAQDARLHLLIREHSPNSLARALGISPPLLRRVLRKARVLLAEDGMRLRKVTCRGQSQFQVLGYDRFVDRAWRRFDRALRRIWATPSKPGRFKRIDQAIYGRC